MSSKIRTMRRAMQKAGKKAVARQVHIFSGLYDEIKKVCMDINTAMAEAHEKVIAAMTDEQKKGMPLNMGPQFIDPSTFIHTVLNNAMVGYWAEKKALVDKEKGKGLITVPGGDVAAKIRAGEQKIEREKR